jgi:1-phosphofructokinase/tagatose 6-phosphate kinase
VDPDLYAELLRDLRKIGVTTIVDTDGEPLRQAVRAEPDVISPNSIEAEELVGHEFGGEEDREYAVREMAALGAREAIMTVSDGCIAWVRGQGGRRSLLRTWIALREAVEVRGAGDAFLAGYASARYGGRSPEESLRFGVACGAESTQRLGTGLIDSRQVERLLGETRVESVQTPAPSGQ